MSIYLSKDFILSFKKLTKNNSSLKEKIKDKLSIFTKNPNNPSLRLHKLKGKLAEGWSFSIDGDIRIVLSYVKDGILLIDIGKHEEVYR